jgi:hypothetical protein
MGLACLETRLPPENKHHNVESILCIVTNHAKLLCGRKPEHLDKILQGVIIPDFL